MSLSAESSQPRPSSSIRARPGRREKPRLETPRHASRARARFLPSVSGQLPAHRARRRARARSCGIVGDAVHLLVAHHLQGVLRLAQRQIGLEQLRHLLGRHELRALQHGQHLEERCLLQPPVAPPRTSCIDCTMNSISRMPPRPSFRSCSSSRRATSRAISAFISRSDSNTPKSR